MSRRRRRKNPSGSTIALAAIGLYAGIGVITMLRFPKAGATAIVAWPLLLSTASAGGTK
jgi:hypothetical protein